MLKVLLGVLLTNGSVPFHSMIYLLIRKSEKYRGEIFRFAEVVSGIGQRRKPVMKHVHRLVSLQQLRKFVLLSSKR